MKIKVNLIGLTLLFVFPSSLTYALEDSYLCVTEEATGFISQYGVWKQANFDVSEEKFIVRKFKKGEPKMKDEFTHGVFPLGSDFPNYWCTFPEENQKLLCRSGIGSFMFSPKTGRFIKTHIFGYWDNKDDTPSISRGKCSKI